MMPDICFLVFAYVCHIHQSFGHICDIVWQFYGNCQTLLCSGNELGGEYELIMLLSHETIAGADLVSTVIRLV